LTWIKIRNW